MSPKFKKSLSLSLLALLLSDAGATQLIDNSDKQHVQVNISARETNRLAIEGRRIANVVPAQPGLINGKKDEAQGVLYFTMSADQPVVGTMTLFVTDDRNVTYKLILVPRPISAEEIILRPPQADKGAPRRAQAAEGRASSYQRRAKELILQMADSEAEGDGAVERVGVNKEVPLWKEARLVLDSKYLDGDMVGEKYSLTNVSAADMLLVEQELFRKGVRAVTIRNQTLPPGDSTEIYIVRERRDNE